MSRLDDNFAGRFNSIITIAFYNNGEISNTEIGYSGGYFRGGNKAQRDIFSTLLSQVRVGFPAK